MNSRWTMAIGLALLLGTLTAGIQADAQPASANTRLEEARKKVADAEARVKAAQAELAQANTALAEAERGTAQDLVTRMRAGDEAAWNEMFDAMPERQNIIDYELGRAVKGGEATAKLLVKTVQAKWGAAGPNTRHKLCWLLGENGSKEAAAQLRAILSAENDAEVAANAIAALRRCPRASEDAATVRKFATDPRVLDEKLTASIGYHPQSTLGDFASAFVADIDLKDIATVPGEIVVEPPTLVCLGFEWNIKGDSNRNCTTEVAYRSKDAAGWTQGFPFLRCDGRPNRTYRKPCGNKLAGSIFNLEPDTEYEVRLTLNDPDGGRDERVVWARTKAEPEVYKGLRMLNVVPGNAKGAGTEADPIKGFAEAVAAAKPGDVLFFHEGTYASAGLDIAKSGEPGKPIVFRGVDADKVTFEGAEKWNVRFSGQKYIHFENISFVNGQEVLSGRGARFIVVRNCKISGKFTVGIEGRALSDRRAPAPVIGREWYIADNVIRGGTDWVKKKGQNWGIMLNGPGHIICHNRISNNWDCISLASDEFMDKVIEAVTLDVDIYENDLQEAMDDGVESDYVSHNVRIFRNRLVNTFSSLSFQPVFGGPCYLLYNAMYNTTNKPFKLHVWPNGMIIAHNTCTTSMVALDGGDPFNVLFRNNLLLGAGGTQGYWLSLWGGDHFDMDYTGYNVPAGVNQLIKFNNVRYKDMASFAEDLGQMKHAVLVDWDVFEKPMVPPGQKVVSSYAEEYLRLRKDGKAIDAGVVMPGINDGFTGAAPDLGCYEFGKPIPQYGPRTLIAK